ncbi:MAG: 2-deoxyribose-5-phosphate aldolase, partial [Spirochaetia bacterium]
MDQNQLIEKIVAEVVARMGSQAAAGAAQAPLPAAGNVLLASEHAKYIDHTLLKPEATEEQVNKLCEEAARHHFYSVCVNSSWAEHCARRLGGTGVKV